MRVCVVTYQVLENSLGTRLDQHHAEHLSLIHRHGVVQRRPLQLNIREVKFPANNENKIMIILGYEMLNHKMN